MEKMKGQPQGLPLRVNGLGVIIVGAPLVGAL
jgi:hypothetical protein